MYLYKGWVSPPADGSQECVYFAASASCKLGLVEVGGVLALDDRRIIQKR
jgi:hypothetical protein